MENQTEHDPEATTVLYLNESRQNVSTAGESLCNSLKCYMVLTQQEKKAIGSICFLAGPVTFLENILVLGVIASSATLRSRPSYLFISSLALADTFASCFFTISFLDFHLYSNNDSPNTYLFKLGGVTMAFTGSVGSLLLTALDRYLCIYQASNYKVCWSGLQLVVLSLIILAYALILWKAHRHEAVMGGPQLGRLSLRGQARMRMDIQLARTFSLILLILAVCWLPVLSFMIIDVSVILTNEQQRMFAFCSTLCLVNSCVNPLLYALRCRELRGELLTLLGCFKALRECNLGNTNVIQQDKNGCEFTRNNKDHTLSESNQETISESIDM
ncbi:cannabinoid receptor 1-like isoform X2 [Myxocyprinus asiaticus]|uniref:cannabinoid receptor 1-like isoform X2 n=1 Tax=Myxocyprinus asiaticus TaxID=70543 RepID=UPI002222A76B|nr:cannabinoid receptor 1-like isoform X2 [Myxocyprinus asiaticus]